MDNHIHHLTASFLTFNEELSNLVYTVGEPLPFNLCVVVTAKIWGFNQRFSTGIMTVHRIEDARLPDIPDELHSRIMDAVMEVEDENQIDENPIDIVDISVEVGVR